MRERRKASELGAVKWEERKNVHSNLYVSSDSRLYHPNLLL